MTNTLSTNKVIFHNSECIQEEAWEMQGVSAKLDQDEAIGKFGTGLCYAIAVLLRTGHKITIKSGSTFYEFGLIDLNFRGKEFKRITCNGKPLSFTTHYGHTWEVWGAYRELVSNTMDEGGIHFMGEPMDEGTSIIVEGKEFAECMKKHNEYFIGDREPLAESKSVDIYAGNGTIYHKGVKVGSVEGALYSYHIKDYLELTEDRTFKYNHQLTQEIGSAIVRYIKDVDIITNIITHQQCWEVEYLDFDWDWRDDFKDIVTNLWTNCPGKINGRIQKLISKKMKGASFTLIDPDEEEALMIARGKEFLAKAGYPITAPIKLVHSEDSNTYAYEYKGTIHLTKKAFSEGLFFLTVALFEENAHVCGYLDMDRAFQNYLVKEVIKQAKGKLKETL
jgi:hypothetical protein